MSPNKAFPETSGNENYAFESDDPNQDNLTTYPEDRSSRCQSNTKGCGINAGILENAAELLASAAERLRCCADCLTNQLDAARETPTLVSQARLHNIKELTVAVLKVTDVIERLKKNLSALQGNKSEKVFTPVLINTLKRESAQVERISKNLSPDKKDSSRLDQDLRGIRTAILRCIESFDPVRQAVFRPDRRGNQDCDRVGNQVREYLRSLDVYWRGLSQAREALPNEIILPAVVDMETETTIGRSGAELFESGATRYWPV